MKEIVKIDKFVGKVHKKFMNTKTTPEDHMTRDMWFSMNLLQLALYNLQRWSETTTTPKKAFNSTLKKCVQGAKTGVLK